MCSVQARLASAYNPPSLRKQMTYTTTFDIGAFFEFPMVDMGSIDPAMKGVYCPERDIGKAKVGVTKQFLSEAEIYHRKYGAKDYFQYLIKNALQEIGPIAKNATVLDIGSGSGNSVLACLELLPDCKIVASDISENMLAILLRYIDDKAIFNGRVVAICMDATNSALYKTGTFNLVTGTAILHHLIDPSTAISAAGKALMPGGSAIFFEPFENGFSILRLAYREIVQRNQEKPEMAQISPPVVNLLQRQMLDLETRTGTDKTKEIFRKIDDKWLFTKAYLEECADKAGFSKARFYPINSLESPFRRQTETILKLGANLTPQAFPPWAWEILHFYDDFFSRELKQDLLLEGCVIFEK